MTALAVSTPASGWSRVRALAICLAMFGAYYAGILALTHFLAPFFKVIPTPYGVTELWWRADKNIVLVGTNDLIAALAPVWLYCRVTGRRIRDLGFNRPGTRFAWALVLAVQALVIYSDTKMGALGHAPGALSTYALFGSAFCGPAAAFAEETLFRGFMTEELRRGGFGVFWQVAISMILFGCAHLSYASGPYGWTIPVFTGLLGGFWSVVYILGKRSLWPPIVAHTINDAVLIPSVFYLMAARALHG